MDLRFCVDIADVSPNIQECLMIQSFVIFSLYEGFVCLRFSCLLYTIQVIQTVIFTRGKEIVIGGSNFVFHNLEIKFCSFPTILLIFWVLFVSSEVL